MKVVHAGVATHEMLVSSIRNTLKSITALAFIPSCHLILFYCVKAQ